MDTTVISLLEKRYACRAISPEPVEQEKIDAIINAAQLSASCMNNQPWRFLVLTEPEALERGRQGILDGNYWAKEAPVLMIGFSKRDLDCDPPDDRKYFLFDVGMAVQNILLQATELDLVARPMAGFNPEKMKGIFSLPDEYTVIVTIAIGYKGDLENLNDKHKKVSTAPRKRDPVEENFFFNWYDEKED